MAAIALVFLCLFLLPFLNQAPIRSSNFRPLHRLCFWLLVADCLLLAWIGQQPVEDPYILIGQLASVYFFLYFLIFLPFLGRFEDALMRFQGAQTPQGVPVLLYLYYINHYQLALVTPGMSPLKASSRILARARPN